ncbi:MAG TPA: hypothetical protein VGI10_13120 [Polyangiaceae bacterium]|jgi:hypothetical protein
MKLAKSAVCLVALLVHLACGGSEFGANNASGGEAGASGSGASSGTVARSGAGGSSAAGSGAGGSSSGALGGVGGSNSGAAGGAGMGGSSSGATGVAGTAGVGGSTDNGALTCLKNWRSSACATACLSASDQDVRTSCPGVLDCCANGPGAGYVSCSKQTTGACGTGPGETGAIGVIACLGC